jgi:hypothetical protein
VLQRQQTRGWHNILTLDESWSYLFPDHERIWRTPEQPVPDRERHMTQSEKLMLTVAWNPLGFYVVTALPKGLNFKFNAGYYIYNRNTRKNQKSVEGAGSWQHSKIHYPCGQCEASSGQIINGFHGCQQDHASFPSALLARLGTFRPLSIWRREATTK